MNKKDIRELRAKKLIEKDILDNMPSIVEALYRKQLSSKKDTIKEIDIVLKTLTEEERHELDFFLGKEDPPPPKMRPNGDIDYYTEIKVDDICGKINIANDVFRHLYRYKFTKDNLNDIPAELIEIFNVYDCMLRTECPESRVEYQKWLTGVGMVGMVRFEGKANNPYFVQKETQRRMKIFIQNIDNIYNVVYNKKVFCDKNDVGFYLWKTEKQTSKTLYFRKK